MRDRGAYVQRETEREKNQNRKQKLSNDKVVKFIDLAQRLRAGKRNWHHHLYFTFGCSQVVSPVSTAIEHKRRRLELRRSHALETNIRIEREREKKKEQARNRNPHPLCAFAPAEFHPTLLCRLLTVIVVDSAVY